MSNDRTNYAHHELANFSKSDLIDLIMNMHQQTIDKRNQAPLPAPVPRPIAPLPSVVLNTTTTTTNSNNNASSKSVVPAAPPLRLGPCTRYDEEQRKKIEKVKAYIDEQTKICSVLIIERYLADIQASGDYAAQPLFQHIPTGVIHVCYQFSTQFNTYLVLMLRRMHYGNDNISMLSIKDIQRTSQDTAKHIHVLTPHSQSAAVSQRHRRYRNMHRHSAVFLPQLSLSAETLASLNQPLVTAGNVTLSAIFRGYERDITGHSLEMAYFHSPYYYDYDLDRKNQKTLRYFTYDIPPPSFAMNRVDAIRHIPFSNQLLVFGANGAGSKHLMAGVLDVQSLQWLTDKQTLKCIAVDQADYRKHAAMCLCGHRLFTIGGVNSGTVSNQVSTLDCQQIANLFADGNVDGGVDEDTYSKKKRWGRRFEKKDVKTRIRPVQVSGMQQARVHCDADVVEIKNQLVVGGGRSYPRMIALDDASKTVEFYDLDQDKWWLHHAHTKYRNSKAWVWCSGNLVFMTGGEDISIETHHQKLQRLSQLGRIECLDIRDDSNQWLVLDERDIQKMFNMYNRPDKDGWDVMAFI